MALKGTTPEIIENLEYYMRLKIGAAFAFAAMAATGIGRAADVDDATQKTLSANYALRCTAAFDPSDANLDAAFAVLAPDFVATDPSGKQVTRDQVVGQGKAQMKMLHATACEDKVESFTLSDPNTVVAVADFHLRATFRRPTGNTISCSPRSRRIRGRTWAASGSRRRPKTCIGRRKSRRQNCSILEGHRVSQPLHGPPPSPSCAGCLPRLLLSADERPIAQMRWRILGPALPEGRASAVTGSNTDPLLYYAGTAGGGIWKTTDGGASWQNVSDSIGLASVGAIAVDAGNDRSVWAGGGETNPRNGDNSPRRTLPFDRRRPAMVAPELFRRRRHLAHTGRSQSTVDVLVGPSATSSPRVRTAGLRHLRRRRDVCQIAVSLRAIGRQRHGDGSARSQRRLRGHVARAAPAMATFQRRQSDDEDFSDRPTAVRPGTG